MGMRLINSNCVCALVLVGKPYVKRRVVMLRCGVGEVLGLDLSYK